jgi:triacylglycerol lipase
MTDASSRWSRRAAIAAGAAAALAGAVAPAARAEDLPWRLPKLRRVRVHGHHMAFFDEGSGPALVLIHGASGSPPLEWGRVITPLSKRFRVIAPYLIGFGPSDQPDLPYDAETFVDYLGGFFNARSIDSPILVGESLGGWVVAQYAVRQGGKTSWRQTRPPISKLVICDGAVQVHPGQGGGGAQDSINSPEVGKLAHDFYVTQPAVDDSKVLKAVVPHVVGQQVADADLKALKTPTLVIWGREDKLLPLESGRHVASQIPGARLVVIDDCGHIPAVEKPRAFLGALGGFLRMGLETL